MIASKERAREKFVVAAVRATLSANVCTFKLYDLFRQSVMRFPGVVDKVKMFTRGNGVVWGVGGEVK